MRSIGHVYVFICLCVSPCCILCGAKLRVSRHTNVDMEAPLCKTALIQFRPAIIKAMPEWYCLTSGQQSLMQCVSCICLTSGFELIFFLTLQTSCSTLSILSCLISSMELQLLFAFAPSTLNSMICAASQHGQVNIAIRSQKLQKLDSQEQSCGFGNMPESWAYCIDAI